MLMAINDEDHDIIIGLKANNEIYQKKLVNKYNEYLLSFALKQYNGLNREDALEVINDVFRKVILYINNFDPNRGCKFKTWLFQIAKNSIIDKLRKINQSSFEEDFQPLDGNPIQVTEGNWQRSDCPESENNLLSTSLLLEVLDELGKNDKTILLERAYDTPFKDIAILIGKTENATKVAHHRALKRLKEACIAKIESKDKMTRGALKAYLNIGD